MNIENLYTPDCIRTYTGIYMNVFEPTLEMIHIEDIAHALSMQCRFGGHLYDFYSVVQKQIREDHVGNGTKPIVSRRFYRGYTIRNHGYYPPDKCVWWEAVDDRWTMDDMQNCTLTCCCDNCGQWNLYSYWP